MQYYDLSVETGMNMVLGWEEEMEGVRKSFLEGSRGKLTLGLLNLYLLTR